MESQIKRRQRRIALTVGLFLALSGAPVARALETETGQPGQPGQPGDTLLVRFEPGTESSEAREALEDVGAELVGAVGRTGFSEVTLPDGDAQDAARELEDSGVVATVEPDRVRRASVLPNDPAYGDWQANYLQAINLPAAWDLTTGSDNLTLAVLDSGADLTHPDLAGRLLQGRDVVDNDLSPFDDQGHGTMVTGVAAAQTNNSAGVAGATWKGTILPVKVLDSTGAATDSDIAAGITWAVDRGADVINLSLGGAGSSVTLQTAVDYATSRNVVVVAAAGNEGDTEPHYPAACAGVVAVGATDSNGNLASFSNYGDWVDIVAPGVALTTTTAGHGYGRASGTSFSTPLVAAAALLLRAADPNAGQATIVDRLRRGARDVGPIGVDIFYGAGLLDVNAALRLSPSFSTGSAATAGTGTADGGGSRLTTPGVGYWMLGSEGRVYPFGSTEHFGEPVSALGPGGPAVDLEPAPGGSGYWVAGRLGGVFSYGNARFHGGLNAGQLRPGETVTSISATPNGDGYWLFTTAGRVFPFGNAAFFGDMAGATLNGRVLDSIPTPTGGGYYMVASDGGIFAFGDARFSGSMGASRLNAPVESLVPDPDGTGYWLVATDGGIFAFDAPFRGSMGSTRLNAPVAGMVAFGDGYLMVGADGGVFNFSDQTFAGSLGAAPPSNPVVSVAAPKL